MAKAKENIAPTAQEIDDSKMTPEERAIYHRVASASDEWKEAPLVTDMEDFSLAEDPFKLPEPAAKLRDAKKYVFRWITRDPRRLDEMMNKNKVFRWYPVNSTAPNGDFAKFVDRNNGAVCREDQMLVFKRYDMFELEQNYKRGLADTSLQSKDPMNKSGDFSAARRKATDGKSLREEVKGSDIQFKGEAEVDAEMGIATPDVADSELQTEE